MAIDESALSEIAAALRAGEAFDFIRELVRVGLQELIESEFTQAIGAGRYERGEDRLTHRNGSRSRLLSTKAGDVELRIPKMRQGSFFPSLLEPRRRIDQALWAVVMEAFVNGVSTRKVDDLVAALGVEAGISKSEVSRICRGLDVQVGAFRSRDLSHIEFPLRLSGRHVCKCPRHRPAPGGLPGGGGGHRGGRQRSERGSGPGRG